MESLDPKIYRSRSENSQVMHDAVNHQRHEENIPELLMFKELQEIWNKSNDDDLIDA